MRRSLRCLVHEGLERSPSSKPLQRPIGQQGKFEQPRCSKPVSCTCLVFNETQIPAKVAWDGPGFYPAMPPVVERHRFLTSNKKRETTKRISVMTERNRAWRRRKARVFLSKLKNTQEWITHQFKDKAIKKPVAALKQHRHGGLTHAQELRLSVSLNDEAHDRAWQANAA